MTQTYRNFIAGEHVAASSGDTIEVRNPADTDEVLGLAPASTVGDARAAIAAAHDAFPNWAGLAGPERGKIFYRAANILESQLDVWATELTREEGKTKLESQREVVRSVDLLRYFAGEAWRVGGDLLPADTPHTLLYSLRVPLGVCAIIMFKPASATPIMGIKLAALLHEAGLPAGVLNVITGAGGAIGDTLVTDERIAAVSFTGSYAVGQALYQKTAPRMTRTHLEMGGKNPVIVAADADLDKAVSIVAAGGFALTGQACTATSRVIVERPVIKEFTERFVAAARKLQVGPGLADGVQMGPAVSKGQRQTDLEYIEVARGEGAQVLAGGGTPDGSQYRRGYFVQPTVLANLRPDMRIAQEEVFGPVVGILEAGDLEEAFAIANNTIYGLTAGVVTNDLRTAIRFAERAEAGMVKVNQGTVGASIQAPFGGFKNSGSGMFREMGKGAIEFFTKIKTIYMDGQ